MDNPMILLIGVAVVAILVVILLQRKKNGAAKAEKRSSKANKEEAASQEQAASAKEEADESWDWNVSSNVVDDTKVSVQDVDVLTEFNVYKQFGYFDKAAESLSAYLGKTQKADANLVKELAGLWLEAKNADALNDTLMQYQSLFSQEELTELIKGGLAIDENHLGLRVLAESSLGWSVKKTAEEIGETTSIAAAPEVKKREPVNLRKPKTDDAESAARAQSRKSLVSGVGVIKDLSSDEKGAVLAFMQPEQSVKLLRDSLSYDAAVKYLNKAIRSSGKPAALLIDALTLDYRANNINGFAGHLWNLYYSLGQYGRQVKERMLGWGYNLGHHPLFERLEANPSEASLREIGMQQGFIDGGSLKKGRYQSLVSEKVDVDANPRTPAERILKESESLLMYGQLDASMELLEDAIKQHPQESQLYIALFDLYERAEEWERLQDTVQGLRSHVQTLPEEVVLAMSQLLQRFNNGSFGH